MADILPGSVLMFGEFEVDCGQFELRRRGGALRMERKPMELLILLASQEGQVVTRTEIAQRLWSSEVFVDTEHGINTAIRKLRYVLGDDPAQPQYIRTVTGIGYRFVAPVTVVSPLGASQVAKSSPHWRWDWSAAALTGLVLLVGATQWWRHGVRALRYTQVTDFTDSAVAPAISADGHMVAFIRGSEWFMGPDQIYVKMLPDGEARKITDDGREKYGLAFSPDGMEVAYTAFDESGFSTYAVSVLGGLPRLMMKNAAGLVWLDSQRVMYSRILTGIHMGVVTGALTGMELKEIYFPAHERGMAHEAIPSPDRRWAIVVEMDGTGAWAPCRLVALEGQGKARTVGPGTGCTAAGWSPDGRWIYLTARMEGRSHLWRQRFPDGAPEQLTFGPTEEEGIAMMPDGRSLITSVGARQSALWVHQSGRDRALSSEGDVMEAPEPELSPDGETLYCLLRREGTRGAELWRTLVATGDSEAVFPGVAMTGFDVSEDGRDVVYTTSAPEAGSEMWLAPVDRSSPATRLKLTGARTPKFGPGGKILFVCAEAGRNYLEEVDRDGTHERRVLEYPVEELQSVSPGRKWIVAAAALAKPATKLPEIVAIPVGGGPARRLCAGYCTPGWSLDGRWLLVPVADPSESGPGRTMLVPMGAGESLPELPIEGIGPETDASVVPGAEFIERGRIGPVRNVGEYAWVNASVHRNLYQVSLP